MSYYRILDDGFFPADTAHQMASGMTTINDVVFNEIDLLKQGVVNAVRNGLTEYQTTANTPMTTPATPPATNVWFEAWSDPYNNTTSAHRLAISEMNAVIQYFSSLGYKVKRERDGVSDNFNWILKW